MRQRSCSWKVWAVNTTFILLAWVFRNGLCTYSSMKKPSGEVFISEASCGAPKGKRKQIVVEEVQLLCDSSEYNDQGNQLYTNSPTCRPYDNASVRIDFQLQNSRYSNYTVLLEIDAGFYRLFEVVQVTANICNVGSLDYMGRRLEGRRIEEYEYDDNEQEEDGGNGGDDYYGNRNGACPLLREGPYQFYTAFTVPDFLQNDGDSSNQMDFTPDLQLKFYDESYNRIGCVETGSLAMYAEGQARRKRGQRLFMFAMFVLVISSSVCFMIYRRRRVAKEFKANRNRRRHMRRIHYLHSSSTSQSSGGGGGRILMSPEMSCSESTDAVSHNTPSLHHQHHQAAVYQPPSNHSRAPSSVA